MTPRLFIDTNVMLDLLGERAPFYESIAKVATLADRGKLILVASSLSYATVNYILQKFENPESVRTKHRKFKIISEIAVLDESTIEKGLNSDFTDFEDALQNFSALQTNCNYLITRNGKDFKESALPVMTAQEYLVSVMKK